MMAETRKPRRIRSDGWTRPRQIRFIKALARTGSITHAADSVGLSASSAYRFRRHPDAGAFCNAWQAALATGNAARHDAALNRAIEAAARSNNLGNRLMVSLLRLSDRGCVGESRKCPETPVASGLCVNLSVPGR